MKHWKNWNKHITSLLLAAAMLVLPVGAVFFNDTNAITVKAEDEKGNDTGKPTVSAAISNGILSIQAQADNSDIMAIYVNGYEFTDIAEGILNIRLQQFDTGYQYFTIQAASRAGNLSEVYKISNPYYTEPETEQDNSGNGENNAGQLPQSASATPPTEAKATVTEHADTEHTDTNHTDTASMVAEAGIDSGNDTTNAGAGQTADGGKEFYTIKTDSEKVFYLIINKDQAEDNVYLLTEVSENDLLNFTEGTTQTLPQNAATSESALPGGSAQPGESEDADGTGETEDEETGGEERNEVEEKSSNTGTYVIMAAVLLVAGVAYYYFKIAKGRQASFDMDEEEDEEEEEAYESEEDDGEILEE